MEYLNDSRALLRSLNKKVLNKFSVVTLTLDTGVPSDYSFTYGLCCYIYIDELNEYLKVSSVETDSGYTIYAETITRADYDARHTDLSKNMSIKEFTSYKNIKVDRYADFLDGEDVLGLCLFFSSGKELCIISGEHYKTDDGYGVSGPDEMVLVFEKFNDIKQYELLNA